MELHQMFRIIKVAVGRMRNKSMSAAFVRWEEFTEESQAMRGLLKKAAMKMMMRQLAGSFARWWEATEVGLYKLNPVVGPIP
jgi:hypothetical protein